MKRPRIALFAAMAVVLWSSTGRSDGEEQSPPPQEPPTAPPGSDAASPELAACFESFGAAQRLRREGRLRASRDRLVVCGRQSCPEAIAQKCLDWLGEVNAAMPSIVVAAKDSAGRDTTEVRLVVDGAPAGERLDGRPIELDPGSHRVVLEHAGLRREQTVLLVAGQKNRRLEVSFARPQSARKPPPVAEHRVSPLVIAGFSVSGAALVAGAVTGGLALARASELEDRCPNKICGTSERSDFDEGAALAHAATASFVIAGVAAAVGAVGLLLPVVEGDKAALTLGPGSLACRGRF